MRRSPFILIITVLFLMLTPIAFAGDILDVIDTKNVNGSIGLYIKNELGNQNMLPDAEGAKAGFLVFRHGDENITVKSGSVKRLRPDQTGLVILDKAWPTIKYINLTIDYDDGMGGTYPTETAYVFAKPGLTLKSTSIGNDPQFSNETLTMTLTFKVEGGDDVKSIDVDILQNPRYFIYESKSVPGKMEMGETRDFVFTFKPQNNMEDTMITTTSSLPLFISYRYFNQSASQRINESVMVFNEDKVSGDEPPVIRAKLEVPTTITQGDSAIVSAYIYNSNTGGHPASGLSLTLSAEDDIIPLHTIIPAETKLDPTAAYSSTPITTFNITIPEGTTPKTYTLTLRVNYTDFEWRFVKGSITKTTTFEVLAKEPEPLADTNTTANQTTNQTSTTPIEPVINDTTTAAPTEQEPPVESPILFYVSLALLLAIVVLLSMHLLGVYTRYA